MAKGHIVQGKYLGYIGPEHVLRALDAALRHDQKIALTGHTACSTGGGTYSLHPCQALANLLKQLLSTAGAGVTMIEKSHSSNVTSSQPPPPPPPPKNPPHTHSDGERSTGKQSSCTLHSRHFRLSLHVTAAMAEWLKIGKR